MRLGKPEGVLDADPKREFGVGKRVCIPLRREQLEERFVRETIPLIAPIALLVGDTGMKEATFAPKTDPTVARDESVRVDEKPILILEYIRPLDGLTFRPAPIWVDLNEPASRVGINARIFHFRPFVYA